MIIADLFTVLRFLLAIAFIIYSVLGGSSIILAATLYFGGWLSDNLDGYLARRSKQGHGKLKDFDVIADIFLVISGLTWVSMHYGVYSSIFVLLYGAAWGLMFAVTGNDAVFMSFSFGGILMTFYPVWSNERSLAIFAIVWGTVTAVVKRKALVDHIRRFLHALK